MADIAVMVIDPGKNRFAQLLDDDILICNLMPLLAGRLGLPRELNYQLIPAGARDGLPRDQSLGSSRIKPGTELHLIPLRDSNFSTVLDKLYEEAKKHAADKRWNLAKQNLDQVFRAFPEYPDPARLQSLIIDYPPGGTAAVPGAATGDAAVPLARASATKRTRAVAARNGLSRWTIVGLLILLAFCISVYIYRVDVGKWWQENRPEWTKKGAKDAQDAYGIYVGGAHDEVIVGQMSVIMDTTTADLEGWEVDDTRKVKDTGAKFRMVRGPFNTPDEARKAYEAELIPGTTRVRSNGTTIARFRFDRKDHAIENATRVLR